MHELGEAWSQGVTRVGLAVLTRLMQTLIWCLPAPACCVARGLNTGTMTAAPPAFALKAHNSDSPYMSMVPFELLSLCWSLG